MSPIARNTGRENNVSYLSTLIVQHLRKETLQTIIDMSVLPTKNKRIKIILTLGSIRLCIIVKTNR